MALTSGSDAAWGRYPQAHPGRRMRELDLARRGGLIKPEPSLTIPKSLCGMGVVRPTTKADFIGFLELFSPSLTRQSMPRTFQPIAVRLLSRRFNMDVRVKPGHDALQFPNLPRPPSLQRL